jgi:cobalt-zinc-cadmium efflux system outer membrane protein
MAAVMHARAQVAEAVTEEEGQLENPELRISGIQLDDILQDKPKLDLGLRISPARPGEIDAKVAAARAEASAVRAEAKMEENLAEAEARWMFANVLLFDAEIEAAEAEAAARKKLADVTRARVERALATRVDEAFAALEREEAAEEAADLKAQREVALGALLDRLGLPPSSKVRLVGDPIDPASLPALPEEEALVEAALAARPELAAAAARMDVAGANAYIERTKRWPWISFVQLGYDFEPSVREGLGWTFAAAVELPLFSINTGGVLRADAQKVEARRVFEAEVSRIVAEVRARHREARTARDLVRSYRDRAVQAADSASEAVAAALDAGQSDLVEMALVERQRSATRRQRLKLLRRYHEALAALSAAVGKKLPAARAKP